MSLLLRLCYLIREENLPLENLIGSDESGCAMMPVKQWRWTERLRRCILSHEGGQTAIHL
jgi:hypothetical protein